MLIRRTLAFLLIATAPLGAQDSTCSYDSCALWQKDGRILAGWPGRKLYGDADALVRLARTDSARTYALDYKRKYSIGMPMSYAGLAGLLTYAFYTRTRYGQFVRAPATSTEMAWYGISAATGIAGGIFVGRAARSAARMSWWYNRNLDRSTSAAQDSSCAYDRCALWMDSRGIRAGMPGIRLERAHETLPRLLEGKDGYVHAERYRKRILRGNTLMWVGGGLLAGSLLSVGLTGRDADFRDVTVETIGFAAGLLTIEAGVFTTISARQEAERAVWWYNRALRTTTASSSR